MVREKDDIFGGTEGSIEKQRFSLQYFANILDYMKNFIKFTFRTKHSNYFNAGLSFSNSSRSGDPKLVSAIFD